jgi:hypothetical protein
MCIAISARAHLWPLSTEEKVVHSWLIVKIVRVWVCLRLYGGNCTRYYIWFAVFMFGVCQEICGTNLGRLWNGNLTCTAANENVSLLRLVAACILSPRRRCARIISSCQFTPRTIRTDIKIVWNDYANTVMSRYFIYRRVLLSHQSSPVQTCAPTLQPAVVKEGSCMQPAMTSLIQYLCSLQDTELIFLITWSFGCCKIHILTVLKPTGNYTYHKV